MLFECYLGGYIYKSVAIASEDQDDALAKVKNMIFD